MHVTGLLYYITEVSDRCGDLNLLQNCTFDWSCLTELFKRVIHLYLYVYKKGGYVSLIA